MVYTAQSVLEMVARNIAAAERGGFDGVEHPEKIPAAKVIFGALYPLDACVVARILNGTHKVVEVSR